MFYTVKNSLGSNWLQRTPMRTSCVQDSENISTCECYVFPVVPNKLGKFMKYAAKKILSIIFFLRCQIDPKGHRRVKTSFLHCRCSYYGLLFPWKQTCRRHVLMCWRLCLGRFGCIWGEYILCIDFLVLFEDSGVCLCLTRRSGSAMCNHPERWTRLWAHGQRWQPGVRATRQRRWGRSLRLKEKGCYNIYCWSFETAGETQGGGSSSSCSSSTTTTVCGSQLSSCLVEDHVGCYLVIETFSVCKIERLRREGTDRGFSVALSSVHGSVQLSPIGHRLASKQYT